MFKNKAKYSIVLFTCIVLSCNFLEEKKEPEDVLAQVGTNQLLLSELKEVIPADYSGSDSMSMAEDYINKWIKQELLVQTAEENLSAEQKDVTRELREYRNSLLIYRYKNELMKQRMDTVVSGNEILEYYENNTNEFILARNIVKAIFIKIPLDYANPGQLKALCDDSSEEGLNELRQYCLQYAKQFDIFIENWVDFGLVSKNIPIEINDEENWLKRNKLTELNDSNYYYLVSIHDFKLKGEVAPVEYVERNISNLIINKRKVEFLKDIENNIYSEGIRKNKFQIFKPEIND